MNFKQYLQSIEEGIEDKLEKAREKAKANGKKVDDETEKKKSDTRKIAGKNYGGSKSKDDDE